MSPLRIGLDLDGVLCDFNTALALELGIAIPYEPPIWSWPQLVADGDHIKQVWDRITEEPEWWLSVPPYPSRDSVRSSLDTLLRTGNVVYFITSRPNYRHVKKITESWIKQHLGVDTPTVLLAHSSMAKGYIAHGLRLTHFYDDKPENCTAVRSVCGGTPCDVAIVDHLYNRDWSHPYVRRTENIAADLHLLGA